MSICESVGLMEREVCMSVWLYVHACIRKREILHKTVLVVCFPPFPLFSPLSSLPLPPHLSVLHLGCRFCIFHICSGAWSKATPVQGARGREGAS